MLVAVLYGLYKITDKIVRNAGNAVFNTKDCISTEEICKILN